MNLNKKIIKKNKFLKDNNNNEMKINYLHYFDYLKNNLLATNTKKNILEESSKYREQFYQSNNFINKNEFYINFEKPNEEKIKELIDEINNKKFTNNFFNYINNLLNNSISSSACKTLNFSDLINNMNSWFQILNNSLFIIYKVKFYISDFENLNKFESNIKNNNFKISYKLNNSEIGSIFCMKITKSIIQNLSLSIKAIGFAKSSIINISLLLL